MNALRIRSVACGGAQGYSAFEVAVRNDGYAEALLRDRADR